MSYWIIALAAYLAVAGIWGAYATRYALWSPPKQGEELPGIERALLVAVGLVASLAWVLLLPVYLRGWLRDRAPAMLARTRKRNGGLPEGSLLPAPPAPADKSSRRVAVEHVSRIAASLAPAAHPRSRRRPLGREMLAEPFWLSETRIG